MGLFGPPDVGKMRERNNVNGLIKALGYKKDHSVRKAATKALGNIRDPRVVEPLIAALKDEEKKVRETAAFYLGKIGDPRVVEPLIDALKKDEEKDVREEAAWMLGKIGDPRAVEPLIAALKDEEKKVREEAARQLGKIGDPRAVEPLIDALKKDEDVGWAAAMALEEIGDPRAVEPLIAALKDEEKDVRDRAVHVLGEIGDPRAVEPLIAALKDKEEKVRERAASKLGRFGDPRAVEPLIDALKIAYDGGGSTLNAVNSLEVLNWQPDQGEAGAIYWACKNEWKKVAELGAPALKALIKGLNASDFEARLISAEALGEIGDPRAVKPLIAALKIEEYQDQVLVCETVAKALDKLGWQADQGETGALYWIAKQEWDKVAALGSPAVEPLIATLEAGYYMIDLVSHQRGYEVIEAIEKNLVNVGKPADWTFRKEVYHLIDAAAKALGKIGEPAVEPLIKKLQSGYSNSRRFQNTYSASSYRTSGSLRTIARVLVHLYHQGTLSEQSKKRILELREHITRRHIDSAMCDGMLHKDNSGIGVDFPL